MVVSAAVFWVADLDTKAAAFVAENFKFLDVRRVMDSRQIKSSDFCMSGGLWCISIQDGARRPGCRASSSPHR
jgi:hypothetical protein